MRKLQFSVILAIFVLSGCTTNGQSTTQIASNIINRQNIVTTTPYPTAKTEKNPKTIAIYNKDKSPHAAYRVIGVATVSKYNLLGVEREKDTMHDMIKNLAASIGGDGLIDVNSKEDALQANVIQFQRILI